MDTHLLKGLVEILPIILSMSIGVTMLFIPAILRFNKNIDCDEDKS